MQAVNAEDRRQNQLQLAAFSQPSEMSLTTPDASITTNSNTDDRFARSETERHLLAVAQRRPATMISIVNTCTDPDYKAWVSLFYMNTNGQWVTACELQAPRGNEAHVANTIHTEFLWPA